MGTVTRNSLVELLQHEVGLSRLQASSFVEAMLGLFIETLIQGDNLKIVGFGTFGTREKAARMGRNPRSGEEALITARRVPYFRPSQTLRDRVNYTK
ncbi:integration host factor subunit alpha [Aristophania vespae]|uniref:Integration host factor subunit alpha n=1 Tax=Aristophania vespae TaxID=2697033 RepID=A0A6P1NBH5_9PROT|nr:integration host factor subunit alpha [Aristophania vespae]QHI95716.1 integration host factor subunit alpha [Aristophania vespae]UMM63408.1 Integration host factor subunit alpha [Aristophania vespae]